MIYYTRLTATRYVTKFSISFLHKLQNDKNIFTSIEMVEESSNLSKGF